jgi:transglutaminase-like putative cysteine protease
MPVVSIRHLTTYRYRRPVAFGEHRMMFRPLESHDQRILSADVVISPEPALLRHVHDLSGATVGVARFGAAAERLVFESRVRVDHRPEPQPLLNDPRERLAGGRFAYDADVAAELARAIAPRHADPGGLLDLWVRRFLSPGGDTPLDALLGHMTEAIRGEFAYNLRLEGAPQDPHETLATRRGSCRDFAVLLIEAARSLGLAARFVSGYVYSGSPKAGRTGGGHTHAWAQVYLPASGWVDFDPTNGIVGATDLVRVAAVIDPRQALPLHGTYAGAAEDFIGMDVEVDIVLEPAARTQPLQHLRVAQAG